VLNFLTHIFGSRNERMLKTMAREVRAAAGFEPVLQALDDAALRAKTDEFRGRLQAGETLAQLGIEREGLRLRGDGHDDSCVQADSVTPGRVAAQP